METPPPELVDYLSFALGQAKFLITIGWRDILEKAGLKDIVTRSYKTNALRQAVNEFRQMNPVDFLRAWGKFVSLIFRDPSVRKWMKEISVPPKSVFRIFKYFGNGLYTCRK